MRQPWGCITTRLEHSRRLCKRTWLHSTRPLLGRIALRCTHGVSREAIGYRVFGLYFGHTTCISAGFSFSFHAICLVNTTIWFFVVQWVTSQMPTSQPSLIVQSSPSRLHLAPIHIQLLFPRYTTFSWPSVSNRNGGRCKPASKLCVSV